MQWLWIFGVTILLTAVMLLTLHRQLSPTPVGLPPVIRSKVDPSRKIPDILLFNHKVDLLHDLSDNPIREQNVRRILKMFPLYDVQFLDDAGCKAAIEATHSRELAHFFVQEKTGMYKSDICRLAQLAQYGGYYMDTDLDLRIDLHELVGSQISFASVVALRWRGPRDPNEMFQAFLAAAPRHPVILSALDKCLDFYRGVDPAVTAVLGDEMRGTALMRLAYEEWYGGQMDPGVQDNWRDKQFQYSYFLEEDRLNPEDYAHYPPQLGDGNNCNIAVFDRARRVVLGYSHVVGSSDCLFTSSTTTTTRANPMVCCHLELNHLSACKDGCTGDVRKMSECPVSACHDCKDPLITCSSIGFEPPVCCHDYYYFATCLNGCNGTVSRLNECPAYQCKECGNITCRSMWQRMAWHRMAEDWARR